MPAFRDNLQIDLEDRRSFVVGNVFFRFLDTLKQTASLGKLGFDFFTATQMQENWLNKIIEIMEKHSDFCCF